MLEDARCAPKQPNPVITWSTSVVGRRISFEVAKASETTASTTSTELRQRRISAYRTEAPRH